MNELEGMKLILASPTYGPTDPICQRDLRIAIMSTAARGVHWGGDASPDRMMFSTARNSVAQMVVQEKDITGVVWVDSDIRQTPMDLATLLGSVKEFNADFVSGVYHQRLPPHHPVFYIYNPKKNNYRACKEYVQNVFVPMDACGFGFVYTSTEMLKRMARFPGFDAKKGWFPDERDSGGFGEDISFGDIARRAGIQLYVNTGVIVGHMGDPKIVYPSDQMNPPEGAVQVEGKWGL